MKIIKPLNIITTLVLCLFVHDFYLYFIFLLFHELGHFIVIHTLGYNCHINFLIPLGINIKISENNILPNEDLLISIAGPLTNLFICILTFLLIPINTYFATISHINLILFLFNIYPASFLDGSRILKALTYKFYNMYIGIFLSNINSVILCFIIIFLAIADFNFEILILNIFILIFIIINVVISCKNYQLEIFKNILTREINIKNRKNIEVSHRIYPNDTKVLDIIKKFCFNKYYIIYIMYNGCLKYRINETELIKYFFKFGNIKLKDCFIGKQL